MSALIWTLPQVLSSQPSLSAQPTNRTASVCTGYRTSTTSPLHFVCANVAQGYEYSHSRNLNPNRNALRIRWGGSTHLFIRIRHNHDRSAVSWTQRAHREWLMRYMVEPFAI